MIYVLTVVGYLGASFVTLGVMTYLFPSITKPYGDRTHKENDLKTLVVLLTVFWPLAPIGALAIGIYHGTRVGLGRYMQAIVVQKQRRLPQPDPNVYRSE